MSRPLAVLAVLAVLVSRAALGDYSAGVRAWAQGDYTAAARAFLPAAEAGEAESQYMMGRLFSLGDGVPRDFVQAWLWFDRAARHGHAQAGQARAELERVLNARQLAEARQLAAPPTPSPPPSPSLPSSLPPSSPPFAQAMAPAWAASGMSAIPRLSEDRAERPLLLVPRRGAVAVTPPAQQQQAAR